MALPFDNISTSLVRNTIGCPSNNVGDMVAKAVGGGVNGWAFNIAGTNATDGYRIDGASPYWNLYSTNAPGQWLLPGNPKAYCHYRLKVNYQPDGKPYMFNLGDFRGYDHSAAAPYISNKVVSFNQLPGSSTSNIITQTVSITFNPGSYQWQQLAPYAALYTHDNGTWKLGPPVALNGNNIYTGNIDVTADTRYATTKVLDTYIALCETQQEPSPIGLLPVRGEITVVVNAMSSVSLSVYVENETFRSPLNTSGAEIDFNNGRLYVNAKVTKTMTRMHSRQRMAVHVINADGIEVVNQTVTNFISGDSPSTLDRLDNPVGSYVTVSVNMSRFVNVLQAYGWQYRATVYFS